MVRLIYIIFIFLIFSCHKKENKVFTLTDSEDTGLDFQNNVPYTEEFNTYTYRNFYNGGGVALGDINNDGLIDIYFTGNIAENKLFINKGNWKFEDITKKAGVSCPNVWSTGATMVDINGDGLLDIYVCKAGKPEGSNRHNELFINQGDLTFKEQAETYGLDIMGLSIHSAFFDYDRDGDLDCYILNNSIRSVGGFDLSEGQRNIPDAEGNKFLRNDNGKFVDITTQAGIYSSKIGYGLGITVSDFNGDEYPDIFISNDFFERDYLYLNKKDGTFNEVGTSAFSTMSMGSMGADVTDLDNDLLPDLFVTEMLPRTLERKKTKTQYETWDKYQASARKGYHHQCARNVLQKNMGFNKFVELGRFSGLADTEWSWSCLSQDFDNDGLKDIFVSNGLYKDLLDKDYLNYSANANMIRSKINKNEKVLMNLIDSMPSNPVKNCMFKNVGDWKFDFVSDQWGMDQLTFSNGSAYGDIDNDGDLDLVINNVNMPAFAYRNNTDTITNKSIGFILKGNNKNTSAIGTKIILKYQGRQSMVENYTSRGFQSSIDPKMHIGLGNVSIIDTVFITWPDGSKSIKTGLKTNKVYTLSQNEAIAPKSAMVNTTLPNCDTMLVPFEHRDIDFNLFTSERLMTEMPGFDGPGVAVGDVNGDKIDDIFVGGGRNQSSELYLSIGKLFKSVKQPFDQQSKSECVKAKFFDSDNDGDLDLYVAHGGKSFSNFAVELHDKLYLNNGKGSFSVAKDLPFPNAVNTGDICISDLNHDGLQDVVCAEKMKNDYYTQPGSIHILYNLGNNQFRYEEPIHAKNLGMMSCVALVDVNGDKYEDIVVGGKWMPVYTILNQKGSFANSKVTKAEKTSGLWNTMSAIDVDNDGDKDIIAGNEGLNSFFCKGLRMYVKDFDGNGSADQIICKSENGKMIPIHDLDELFSQIPSLKKKFVTYRQFASIDIETMFGRESLVGAATFDLDELQSVIFINDNGNLKKVSLPKEAQFSSIHAIFARKNDNVTEMFFGGNHFKVKPQFGRQDGSMAWFMKCDFSRKNPFFDIKPLYVEGQIRSILPFGEKIVFGINNSKVLICNNLN
ncbi:MAG: VCBS repeat-containing protein [Saprospiraceae bacterium]|nr:VCBS repeat-containing protein [Saprospiraceae bacterium]